MKTVILAVLFLSMPVFARLGETPAELVARYGKPIKSDSSGASFRKSGFTIQARLIDGKCEQILYVHQEGPMDADQIAVLLTANKGTSEWGKGMALNADYVLERKDKSAVACIIEESKVLSVQSAKWSEKKKRDEGLKKREAMKGF